MLKKILHLVDVFFTDKTVATVLLALLIISDNWKTTSAGSCWNRVENSGRCQSLQQMGISKEDCCNSGSVDAGWTPHDEYTEGRLFYFKFMSGGAPDCHACHQTCTNVECSSPDRKCRIKDGRARCVCAPDCSQHDDRHRGLVCGSDGNTYRNYCTLLKMNCRRERHTQVEYFGRCQYSCDKVRCNNGLNCVEDQNGIPHCISCRNQIKCPPPQNDQQKICGADGNTYASTCHLRKATCLNGRSIGNAYDGECDSSLTCSTLNCPPGKKCLVNPETERPQCVTCDGSCSAASPLNTNNPICGTDGTSYGSWCSMQNEACKRGVVIETKHYGPCHQDGQYGDYPQQSDDYNPAYYYLD